MSHKIHVLLVYLISCVFIRYCVHCHGHILPNIYKQTKHTNKQTKQSTDISNLFSKILLPLFFIYTINKIYKLKFRKITILRNLNTTIIFLYYLKFVLHLFNDFHILDFVFLNNMCHFIFVLFNNLILCIVGERVL